MLKNKLHNLFSVENISTTGTAGEGGTGLGLFIANRIAEAHGGKIHIESESDKGSKFIVTMLRKQHE